MTNIWANSFTELREPFFNIEDPYVLREEKENGKEKEEKGEKKHKEGKAEEESEKAGEKYEGKYKKTGKKSKDYDGDGTVEDEADEYAGVKDRAIKKAMKMKEDRDISAKKDSTRKLDNKKSVSNKIEINPSIKESKKWIQKAIKHPGALHKQLGVPEGEKIPAGKLSAAAKKGGKLGQRARLAKTLKGMHEEIETVFEADTTMAPKGDAQTVKATDSNKSKVAQMQIRKELADVQLAKAKKDANQTTNESVIAYLYNRYNLSE